jgi:DNA-binding beta-propeller fold protein YncE
MVWGLDGNLRRPPPAILYNANPNYGPYYHQEIFKIVGHGGANPCVGTFTPKGTSVQLDVTLIGQNSGGAMATHALMVGVSPSAPTVPIFKEDPVLGSPPLPAAGITGFQVKWLASFGWETITAVARQIVVITGLTPGTTYTWQIAQIVQAAAVTINVGTSPVTPDISPDDKTVWVPNSGANTVVPVSLGARPNWIMNGGQKDVLGNPMSWYPIAGTPIALPAGSTPFQCLVSPNGAYVAVANNLAKTVTIINAATKAVVVTSAALAASPGIKSLFWSSDSTVVWVALPNGTIVPITAATGAVGAAVTVAAGKNLFGVSKGTVGWAVDLTGTAYPLSGLTGGAVTVGAGITLPYSANCIAISPNDGSLWTGNAANKMLTRTTTAGVQSSTALTNALSSITGMALSADGQALWLSDYTGNAFVGFSVQDSRQVYYSSGGALNGTYGVAVSATCEDLVATSYSGGTLRVWPGSFSAIGTNAFPPGQGVTVLAEGV